MIVSDDAHRHDPELHANDGQREPQHGAKVGR